MRPRLRPTIAIVALICAQTSCRSERPPQPSVGEFVTDDSVRIYYRILGSGPETVVVPMAIYLEDALAPLASPDRRLVFYDPRHRGRSGRGELSAVSLDRQVQDLEQLRLALGVERMSIIGWSGLGMETAVYALRHPDRVTRLVQVSPVPPAARIMREAGGDARAQRTNQDSITALDRRARDGAFANAMQDYCRARERLTLPSNFVDTSLVSRVTDVCRYENEWPTNLGPFFGALVGSFGDYDWTVDLAKLEIPRLVIHGREDGIPLAGAEAWVAGFPHARLLVLSPAGHFPFLERPNEFFSAVNAFLSGEWPESARVSRAHPPPERLRSGSR
jgi:proline iminopeptidase